MPEPTATRSTMIALGCFAAVAATAFFGASFGPGEWYTELNKVPWNPPNWVFGPAWTLLYVLIGVAGWMIFTRTGSSLARGLWVAQLVVNALWSWLFFGLQNPLLALIDISVLLVLIGALMVVVRPRVPVAFWLLLPYLLWVAYALSLNAGIVVLNPTG